MKDIAKFTTMMLIFFALFLVASAIVGTFSLGKGDAITITIERL